MKVGVECADELEVLARQIKEALLLEREERAEELREELLELLEFAEG